VEARQHAAINNYYDYTTDNDGQQHNDLNKTCGDAVHIVKQGEQATNCVVLATTTPAAGI